MHSGIRMDISRCIYILRAKHNTHMKRMTFLLTALVAVFLISNVTAQEDKSKRASPPAQATGQVGDVTVTIDYSSPGVKGRDIWDGLVPYGKVW